ADHAAALSRPRASGARRSAPSGAQAPGGRITVAAGVEPSHRPGRAARRETCRGAARSIAPLTPETSGRDSSRLPSRGNMFDRLRNLFRARPVVSTDLPSKLAGLLERD